MKKIFVLGFIFMMSAMVFAKDKVIPASSLPAKAQDFIAQNFSGSTATYVEADWNEYEVQLDDGTEIQFKGNGDWKDIKSYQGVPKTILSNVIYGQLDAMFPEVNIIEVEKEKGNIEVKMGNRMKVYFSANGKLIGQKYDD